MPSARPDPLLAASWFDGRGDAHTRNRSRGADLPADRMIVCSASLGTDDVPGSERLPGERVCTGCATAGDVLAACRDRARDEVREFAVCRPPYGAWARTIPVHDDGRPIERADIALLEGRSARVSRLEAGARGEKRWLRGAAQSVERPTFETIARLVREPTMGFPRMVRAGGEVLIAWSVADGSHAIGSVVHSTRDEESGR